MADITAASNNAIPTAYEVAFDRTVMKLSETLQSRIRRCRAILVRSRPMIQLGRLCIQTEIETLFEQAQPCVWRFRSQSVHIIGHASHDETLAVRKWGADRRRRFVDPDGPRMLPVLETLKSVLESGREGRDFVLLGRVPVLVG